MIEKRTHLRTPIDCPLTFRLLTGKESMEGVARDISVGGMFIATATPPAFGAEIVIDIVLPTSTAPMSLPAVVRWTRSDGVGVQFRPIGAKETHLITEVGRKVAG